MPKIEEHVDPSVQHDLNADRVYEVEKITFSHKEAAVFSTMNQQNSVDNSQAASLCLSNIKTMEQSHKSLDFILHFWCRYCEFSADNKKELVTHMHCSHMKPCSFCSFRSFSQADLTKHVEYEHSDRFGIACSSNTGLDRDPVSMCEFCSFMTYSTEHLQKHTFAEHTGMQPKHTAKWILKTISAKVRKADATYYSSIIDEASESEMSGTGKDALDSEPGLFSNDIRVPVQGLQSVEGKDIPHWSEHPPSTNQNKINHYNSDEAFSNSQSKSLIGNSVDFNSQSSRACDPTITRNLDTNFVTVSASNAGLELNSESIKKDPNLGHPVSSVNTIYDSKGQSSPSECQELSTPTTSRKGNGHESILFLLRNDFSTSGDSPLKIRVSSKPLKSNKLSTEERESKSKKNDGDCHGGNGVAGGESQQIKLEHGHNDESFQRLLQTLESDVMIGRLNMEIKAESSGQQSDDAMSHHSHHGDSDDEPHLNFSPENDKEMREDQNSASIMSGKQQDSFPSVGDLKAFHPCNLCSLAFSTSTLLVEHTAKQHKEDDTVMITRSKRSYDKRTDQSIQLAESQTSKRPVISPKRKRGSREQKHPTKAQGGETPFKCEECGKYFKSRDNLKRHKTIHTEEKKYSCDECGRKFRRSTHLRTHKKLHRGGVRKFMCTLCRRVFTQECRLVIHMRIHTGERPYKCIYCDNGFKSEDELIVHTRRHTGEKPYECKLCNKSYALSRSMNGHMRSDTHKRNMLLKQAEGNQENGISTEEPRIPRPCGPQPCLECGKVLQPNSMKRHQLSHNAIRPYKCSKCGRDFIMQCELTKHVKIVHAEERRYQCHICEKKYKDGATLKKHIKKHTGVKPFKCTECDKCYNSKDSLNAHMSIHTGEQRLLCSICGKNFRWNAHLTRHLKMHSGEKPYQCTVCGMRFGPKNDLRKHMTIHTEKRYKCSLCAKTFRSNSVYQNHMSKYLEGRLHSCTMCDKIYHRRVSLRQHIQKKHKMDASDTTALPSTMVSLM